MSRLFDPRRKDGTFPFEWTRPEATDIRKTFERVRAQQQPQPKRDTRPVPRLIKRSGS